MRCARCAICRALPIAVAFALAGCGVVRPSDYAPVCPVYETTLRPVLEKGCGDCHSATKAAGGYTIGDYAQTVSRRDDGTPRVEGGARASLLLAAAHGELPGHAAIGVDDAKILEDWVVACRAAPRPFELHPKGWMTSTDSEQFHGQALRASHYDFADCKTCHGADLLGGKSQVDCHTCHREGPQACNTCHGDKDSPSPPRDLGGARAATSLGVGAHRTHLANGVRCTDCHADVKDDAHYRRADAFTRPAALLLPSGPSGEATWNRATATCTNVYCHAPAKDDTAPTRKDPVWTKPGKLTCGSCHGNPPSSHATTLGCEVCHGAGYADGGVDIATHLDGKVTLRNGGVSCDACHSGPDSASFRDLQGRGADAGVKSVGAHDAHLHANRLRGPMGCAECHVVPKTVLAPGHLDSAAPAEVFSMDLGSLAFRQGAAPIYNAANGTCASVYCHGGGQFGHVDSTPTLLRTPSWLGKSDQAACGTCHGLPPIDGTIGHNPALNLGCDVCHGGSVQADGGIVFSAAPDGGLTSRHLDGKITGQ